MPEEATIVTLVAVRAQEPYNIWLRYDDGTEGVVDLSDLAGRGVFLAWDDPEFFARVWVGDGGSATWSDDIDVCGDALYMRLTGVTVAEMFPEWRDMVDA